MIVSEFREFFDATLELKKLNDKEKTSYENEIKYENDLVRFNTQNRQFNSEDIATLSSL